MGTEYSRPKHSKLDLTVGALAGLTVLAGGAFVAAKTDFLRSAQRSGVAEEQSAKSTPMFAGALKGCSGIEQEHGLHTSWILAMPILVLGGATVGVAATASRKLRTNYGDLKTIAESCFQGAMTGAISIFVAPIGLSAAAVVEGVRVASDQVSYEKIRFSTTVRAIEEKPRRSKVGDAIQLISIPESSIPFVVSGINLKEGETVQAMMTVREDSREIMSWSFFRGEEGK